MAVRAAAGVWCHDVFLFLAGGGGGVLPGAKNRRDLHPIRRYRRWRGLLKGWVVPTMPARELYVQGTQEPQLPGIETPHWTTEDYRSRYWAVYVSYQFSCSANRRGVFPRGVSLSRTWYVSLSALAVTVC